jgi:hypothetical protein
MIRYHTFIDSSTEIGQTTIDGILQNGSEFGVGISSEITIDNLNVFSSVGIGTTIPQSELDVSGTITTQSISGITTITPVTELNVNGGLVVSGVSTVGLGTTSNLTQNSTLSFELTSNTNLRIRVRGTDGVIRSANLTLS